MTPPNQSGPVGFSEQELSSSKDRTNVRDSNLNWTPGWFNSRYMDHYRRGCTWLRKGDGNDPNQSKAKLFCFISFRFIWFRFGLQLSAFCLWSLVFGPWSLVLCGLDQKKFVYLKWGTSLRIFSQFCILVWAATSPPGVWATATPHVFFDFLLPFLFDHHGNPKN